MTLFSPNRVDLPLRGDPGHSGVLEGTSRESVIRGTDLRNSRWVKYMGVHMYYNGDYACVITTCITNFNFISNDNKRT